MIAFSFPVPIESVPLLDDCLTVAAAARQLASAEGRPAIVLDRMSLPLGLLFPHRLLLPEAHPERLLGSLSATLLVMVPLVQADVTRELLKDCALIVRQPETRYAIAIEADGQAIGVIDLFALTTGEPVNRSLPMIVDRFAHGVASPLMGVLSLVSLLEDERLATLPASVHTHVHAIGHSADRMASELERLNLAARAYQGTILLHPEPMTLDSLCWQAIDQFTERWMSSSHQEVADSPNQTDRELRSGMIDSVAIWLDRRYGLHLFTAAIECVLGRYGQWLDLSLTSAVMDKDLVVSLRSDASALWDTSTSQSLRATIASDQAETLAFLQMLSGLMGGDVNLKPCPGSGFCLDLLIPNVVMADEPTTPPVNHESGNINRTRPTRPDLNNPNIPNNPPLTREASPPRATSRIPSQVESPAKRAIVLTQRLNGDDLACFDQPGWYVTIALSIRELLDKVAQLSPQLVLLDCETEDLYRHLMPQLSQHLHGSAIATIRGAAVSADPIQRQANNSKASVRRIPDAFTLHYPLQPTEVASCFQWASVLNSTLILLDLHDQPAPLETPFNPAPQPAPNPAPNPISLAAQLRQHYYRIIEVNDLTQAQLFAEIWQPHIIVLQVTQATNLDLWPQRIEDFADRVKIPCLVVTFPGLLGQASRLDRSIVYWSEPIEPERSGDIAEATIEETSIVSALQWLQHHYPNLN